MTAAAGTRRALPPSTPSGCIKRAGLRAEGKFPLSMRRYGRVRRAFKGRQSYKNTWSRYWCLSHHAKPAALCTAFVRDVRILFAPHNVPILPMRAKKHRLRRPAPSAAGPVPASHAHRGGRSPSAYHATTQYSSSVQARLSWRMLRAARCRRAPACAVLSFPLGRRMPAFVRIAASQFTVLLVPSVPARRPSLRSCIA